MDPDRGGAGGADPEDPAFPARRAAAAADTGALDGAVTHCRACPRLVAWREETGRIRRRAFRDWEYWSRPVPDFGPADAALAVVGLAPAAHGGNRTGRAFTGDPSGDVLFAALHAEGLASQPTATARDDGLRLRGVRIAMPVHCAPPDNRPTPAERDTCRPWLTAELRLLRPTLKVIVVLGGFGWQALFPPLADAGWQAPRPRPAFGHARTVRLTDGPDELTLFGCYHPSHRNIATGRLTPRMLRAVLHDASTAAGL